MRRAVRGRFWLLAVAVTAAAAAGCGSGTTRLSFLLATETHPDRALRLRIHVSGTYAAQPLGTHAHLRAIVHDADRIFSASIGAHLVLAEIVDGWAVDVASTGDALAALRDRDPGGDVDVVVGMLGGASRREDGCLGMAVPGGDHMVVRSEDAEGESEHDAAVVAFLHELGHTLGAPHDREPGSIMNAENAPGATRYGQAAAQIIRSGLGRRGIVADPSPALLRAARPPADPPARPVATEDRPSLARALDAERRGDPEAAWHEAEALFRAYPDTLEVQDLRCRLARARDLPWADVRAQCARLMELTLPGAEP